MIALLAPWKSSGRLQRHERYDLYPWNPQDYSDRAKQGNIGCSYPDVLPYFQKAEHQVCIATEGYGSEGPLDIADMIQGKV